MTFIARTLAYFCFLISFFISSKCFSQNTAELPLHIIGDSSKMKSDDHALITGNIRVKGSSAPVNGASISVHTFKYFDYSDPNGKYAIDLPPGKYTLTVRHVGMMPVQMRILVLSGGLLNIDMEEGQVALEELVVTARNADSNVKESVAGLLVMSLTEVKKLPSLTGEIDILKTLQLMPGVSSAGEGSSGINVRGGRTDQNLILFNDVPIFSTSHALGFVSAFNQDYVRDFNLYKGNVPAQFGGRASSVLQINTREGNFEKWQFQGGIGPLSTRLTAEGPLRKNKTSLLVSLRASHANWILKKMNDPKVKSSASSFEDGYLNLSHRLSEHSNMSIQYYGSNDYFRFAKQFAYKWTNSIITTRVNFATHRKASPTVSLSYGSYRTTLVNLSGLNASEIENTMKYAQIKTFVNYVPNEKHTIATGIEMVGYLPTPEKRSPHENSFATAKKVDKTRGVELALFVNDEYQINDFLAISAGLRFVSYHHIGKDTIFNYGDGLPYRTESITDTTIINSIGSIKHYPGLEPRFSARISLSSKESIKISYNRMRQNIHLISNSAAPTPIDLWQVSTKYIPPQISDNFSVGYSRNMKDNLWETSVEGFYKKVQNLVEYRDFPDLYLNPHIETELLSGKGEAYGVELYIRRLKGRWTGWASYTYARSFVRVDSEFEQDEINKGKLFPSNYDKPHSFNLVLDRHIGKKGGYAMVATYNTGRPFTAVETSYIVNGTTVPVYSDRNKYRIPSYLRFDFSVTFGNVFKKWDDSLIFSIYNLFGRDNPYSVFYQRPSSNFFIPKAYKLSIMGAALPSVTYTFKF